MKRTLTILLVLRYPTSSGTELVSAMERGLDCADHAGDLPVHWSYPVQTLLGDSSSRADRIVTRLKARSNDRMLPIGYAASHHALLRVDELRKELEWCRSNPWNEDFETAFGSDEVAALFPLAADLSRAKSRSVYTDSYRLLTIDHQKSELVTLDGESFLPIPLLMSDRIDSRRLGRELNRYYRRDGHDRVAVMVNGLNVSEEELTGIFAIIERLRERRNGFAIRRIDALPEPPPSPQGDIPSLALRVGLVPNDPASRTYRVQDPEKVRGRRRRADELIRRRLARLAVVDPNEIRPTADHAAAPSVDDRTLIADMSGVVNLTESDMSVRFDTGRLAGMAHGSTKVVAEHPIRSYFRLSGTDREFTTVSTFSFEGERCRGLRTILALSGDAIGQSGQIVADYFFEDGQDDLLATITVTYPEVIGAALVEEYAVLELPLFDVGPGESIDAQCEYPDGERYTARLEAKPYPFQLFGQSFTFRSRLGEFRLAFLDLRNAVPEVIGVRFRSNGRTSTLCVNPRGSYTPSPASAFTAVVEQFRLAMAIAPARSPESSASREKAVPMNGEK